MATRLRKLNVGYGLDNALQDLAPRPIKSQRAPTTNDFAPIGTQWIDQPNNAVYSLTSIVSNSATWTSAPSSGLTASLTVTGASDLQGNTTVGGTLDVTGDTTVANMDVTGTLDVTGDLDLTSAALIDLTSTLDADPAILLRASGGTSEVLRLHSDQGTSVDSIDILSDVGGITLTATSLASDNAINLEAVAGGIYIDAAMQVNITSSEDDPAAISFLANSGGISILANGEAGQDINIINTGGSVELASTENTNEAVLIRANGGTSDTILIYSEKGSSVNSVDILSDVGGIALTATGLASDGAINLNADSGGVSVDAAMQASIASSENAADAILINATQGGIDLTAAGGLGEDIDLVCTSGSVNITGGEAVADAITIQSSNAAGGISISSGTGDLDVDSTGNVNVTSTLDAADSVYIRANGGTSEAIRVHSDQGSGIGSIELESDAGGVRVTTAALAATTGLHVAQGAATAAIQVGSGAPTHNAPKGSLYLRTDGSSTSTRAYIATDAAGTWTNITTAA